jgi:hypothetical protein
MSGPKRSLPSLGARQVSSEPPSIDEARGALGGRVTLDRDARLGALARFRDAHDRDVEGIVVCETETDLDVWIGDGRFQRIAITRASITSVSTEHPLADVAADARLFLTLDEGHPVRFLSRDGSSHDGVLAERCRYGALVSFESRLFAVSFRRLWPLEGKGA